MPNRHKVRVRLEQLCSREQETEHGSPSTTHPCCGDGMVVYTTAYVEVQGQLLMSPFTLFEMGSVLFLLHNQIGWPSIFL